MGLNTDTSTRKEALPADVLLHTPLKLAQSGDVHYRAVSDFYEGKFAARTGLRYMNHIDEGLYVLDAIGAGRAAQQAYCLHPLFQSDPDIAKVTLDLAAQFEKWPLVLVTEYRHIANSYSSRKVIESLEKIRVSPLEEVRQMLIADKIQNFKDFELYHKATHPRSEYLNTYFSNWLQRLGVDTSFYRRMVEELARGAHLR